MRNPVLGHFTLLFIIFTFPLSLQAAEWQRVHSQTNDFSVLMPGTPKFSASSSSSPVGRIPEEICEYKSDQFDLTAEVSVLPAIAVLFGGHQGIINKASAAYLEHIKGKLSSSAEVKGKGFSGKEIRYTAVAKNGRPYHGRAQFFLVQKRLYVLVGDSYDHDPDAPAVGKFLNSFQLENRPKKKPRMLHTVPLNRKH